jgi:tRNA A-37 threonylcarbamoyl transferase component Bud32
MESSRRSELIRTTNGWQLLYNDSTCNETCFSLIQDFIASGEPPGDWVKLNSSANSRVWKFSVDDRWFVFKEFLKRGRFDTLKALLTGSRAHKAWQRGNELRARGFNAPEVLIYGYQSLLFTTQRSFILMNFLMHSMGLHTLLKDQFSMPLTPEKVKLKRSLLRSAGRFIGKMHAEGIFHGDLRLDTILVNGWETGAHTFSLIDNERNRYFTEKRISTYCRRKNLVQVNMVILPQITSADRLRFFMAYLSENPKLYPAAKDLIRKVHLKTKKRLSKKRSLVFGKNSNGKVQDLSYNKNL